MKTFAVLLTTAVLGSAAFAAGTNMMQDELSPDSRPARVEALQEPRPSDPDRRPDPRRRHAEPSNDGFLLDTRPPGPARRSDDRFDRPSGEAAQSMGMGMPGMMMPAPATGPGMNWTNPDGRYMRPRAVTRTIVETHMEPLSKEEIAEQEKLAEATRLLHTSKDEAERQKAADTIREQLNAQFDRDLKRREKELTDIEARLKTLREQVEKRKAARDRIVGLKLDTIINEADGLGFPGEPGRPIGPDPFDVGQYRVPGLFEPARVDNIARPVLEDRLTPDDAFSIDPIEIIRPY